MNTVNMRCNDRRKTKDYLESQQVKRPSLDQ